MLKLKLFCFPYAGGSAAIYARWKSYLNMDSCIELIPIELAGRGKRISEPLNHDLEEVVEDLYQKIKSGITNGPYAFFGHSLGGLLIYELAQKIKGLNIRQPVHLFFSGKSAPDIAGPVRNKYHLMDDNEFKQEVIKLGGTPPEFFEHPELTDLFLPMLRNDFRLADTGFAQRRVIPFDCDISIFSGKEDYRISKEQVEAWKTHTRGLCAFHYFNGGHFFLHDEAVDIIRIIDNTLKFTLQQKWSTA
ncbi:Surfactin synthase thioesterase subunit [Mucilaginibacter lappiensis]|uniref:Surfactin synthase thioesterase subunit n=1 Tax=Mucilaginibacter lappiensis TaxID=354630 RepID=A0ABR6PJL8_9SPHI|nr:thioesterase domain-containing protein [Mucilaginibacter lappiensis]MBB6109958.1 surfactin synthase thioesterase subunit [Mucilaginibacter lappiensis]SIR56707.1 Surfactin synthase thioesterase subunit [Mucilaginibacter lappiensis]